jgi:diaminopimelate epimerase
MHGIGNDFVLYDEARDGQFTGNLVALATSICDRNHGVGADGLIVLQTQPALQMRMFNPDGSESEMCGNGLRAFARAAFDRGYATSDRFQVLTGAGALTVEVLGDMVKVDMGVAKLTPHEIGMTVTSEHFVNQSLGGNLLGTAVSMGNPHLVLFVPSLEKIDLALDGALLEKHPFFPHRTNVHFVTVLDRTHLRMKTWERGAGATLACGTGACSVAVASFLNQHSERSVEIELPGGNLQLEFLDSGHVLMTGSASYVFEGEL